MNSLVFIDKEIEKTKALLGIAACNEVMFGDEDNEVYKMLNNQLKGQQEVKSDLEEYQKLKEKAIPQKLVERKEIDVVVGEYTAYDCPNCKQEQVMIFPSGDIVGVKHKYCSECATALDWNKK